MTFTPTIGSIIAIVMIIVGILMALSVLPASPVTVGASIAALAIARLT